MTDRTTSSVEIESGWMRPSDAARALGVSRQAVLMRAARGQYRTKVVGGVVFVGAKDVLREVEEAAEMPAAG